MVPSSAMAKKMRGPVIMAPLSAPSVERTTSSETSPPPQSPASRSAVDAATSSDAAISGTDSTLRYAAFTRR